MGAGADSESRKLNGRHVQFIAIGGAIGAGLFVGSGEVISIAGPAVLFGYAFCGFIIFLVARAMGELAVEHPEASGFTEYAAEYIGGWAGFLTGWSYWLNWVLVVIAEITAVGFLVRFWFPDLPQWLPGMLALLGVWGINILAARLFAEAEFVITLVKVATIVLLILGGGWAVLNHIHSSFGQATLANLYSHGGLFPSGILGFIGILPIVLFAFGGVEVIGVAAAEMENPRQTVPKAVNSTVLRILIFYVGALAVAMSLVPWSAIKPGSSPFVLAFGALGIPGGAGLVNFVVLTAVLSSCNTGVFATSRVLRGLALVGQAPVAWATLSRRGVPFNAMLVSVLAMFLGVLFNYLAPATIFSAVMRADAALMLWIWFAITWAHFNYRRKMQNRGIYKPVFGMPFYPYSNLLVMIFIIVVCGFNFIDLESAAIFMAAIAWFGVLFLVHARLNRRGKLSGTSLPTQSF